MPTESTDYAARAKALLRKTLTAGALVIVPIALAVNADASVVLPTNGSCTLGFLSAPNCFVSGNQLPDQNGMTGFSLAGGGGYSATGSGSGDSASIHLSTSGPLTIDSGGSNCAGVGNSCHLESFLFSWNIYIDGFQSGGQGRPPVGVKVTSFSDTYSFRIGVDGTELFSGSAGALVSTAGSGSASQTSDVLSGSASILLPAEFQSRIASLTTGSPGGEVAFTLDIFTTFDSSTYSIPPNSVSTPLLFTQVNFSVTAEAPTAAPEPGTTGLTFGGLLLAIGAWFRRRRHA